MNEKLRSDAQTVIDAAISAVLPETSVERALEGMSFAGEVVLAAAGKAAWRMAARAQAVLREKISRGIVITKYSHVQGEIPGLRCFEAGHPVPDARGVEATRAMLSLTEGLRESDTVLFLLSGGASALFELPLIPLGQLQDITNQLLRCGADIVEINTIRKRLSAVKGGKFALHCAPAAVKAVVLSDVLGDPLDMIASGPVTADSSTCAQALDIVEKYGLRLSGEALELLRTETPKRLTNVDAAVVGSVRALCGAAREACKRLGYETLYLTDMLSCEARDAGRQIAELLRAYAAEGRKLALIEGGETVVHLSGSGLGGRNQEIALAASESLAGLNAAVFSVASDGTDGPTDAAGGYVDGDSLGLLTEKGLSVAKVLAENDSYHALEAIGGLIVTGPTGTNVNDLTVALLGGES